MAKGMKVTWETIPDPITNKPVVWKVYTPKN